MKEQSYDLFGYRLRDDGFYSITKNGEHFLTCTGNEQSAKNIVRILNEDSEEKECEKNTGKKTR